MSPLPAIPLEVERYIGACLISNHNHQKSKQFNQGEHLFFNRERYAQHRNFHRGNEVHRCGTLDGWAGGMPLISFANQNRVNRPDLRPNIEDYNLARLAVHTQGAPLILSKTYNHRKNKLQRNHNTRNPENSSVKHKNERYETSNPNVTADTVSVTSDESYGSGNSDQCLPRIIKPRKRRKKDRKLPSLHSTDSQEFSSDSTSPEIVNPTGFLSLENSPYYASRVFDFLGTESGASEIETPKLHHSFEEIEDVEDSKNPSTTQCQCRYCDPSGQIWDIDKSSYSSFLTPPDSSNVFTYPEFKSSMCLIHELARLKLNETQDDNCARNCDIVERKDLEVSTEIVTSLNGHRDLEIKFFSTASADNNTARTSNNKEFAKNLVDIETC